MTPAQRSPIGAALHDALTFVGLLPDDADNHLIKRVIGLPGDHVVLRRQGGPLTVNGVADQRALPQARRRARALQAFDITVPAGKVWVMGDHRSDSSDSRFHPAAATAARARSPSGSSSAAPSASSGRCPT